VGETSVGFLPKQLCDVTEGERKGCAAAWERKNLNCNISLLVEFWFVYVYYGLKLMTVS